MRNKNISRTYTTQERWPDGKIPLEVMRRVSKGAKKTVKKHAHKRERQSARKINED